MGDPASLACRQHRGAGGVRVRGVGTHHRRQPRRKTSPGSRCSWGRWHRHWLALTQPPSCRYSPGGHRQPARWCALSTGTTGTCRHRAGHRHPPPPPAPPFCNRDVPSRSRCPPKPPQPHHSPSWQGLGQVLLVLRSPQVWGQGGTRALSQPPAPTNTIWGSQPGREGGKQGCSGTGCSPSHPSARPLHPGTLSPPPPAGVTPSPHPIPGGSPQGCRLQGWLWRVPPRQGCPPFLGGGSLQLRVRLRTPPPHSASQGDQDPQAAHPPGTGGRGWGAAGRQRGWAAPAHPPVLPRCSATGPPGIPLSATVGSPSPPPSGTPAGQGTVGVPAPGGGRGPWWKRVPGQARRKQARVSRRGRAQPPPGRAPRSSARRRRVTPSPQERLQGPQPPQGDRMQSAGGGEVGGEGCPGGPPHAHPAPTLGPPHPWCPPAQTPSLNPPSFRAPQPQ